MSTERSMWWRRMVCTGRESQWEYRSIRERMEERMSTSPVSGEVGRPSAEERGERREGMGREQEGDCNV